VYSIFDYPSKRALRTAVEEWESVACYQPGPFGLDVPDGEHLCEGPHYPKPHRWYAWVEVQNGQIIRVIK
jgi:hypothetical protein